MATDTRVTRRHAGYSQAEVTQPPTWHGLVVWDLLFNNLTTGLFLVAAIAELARPSIFGAIGKVAYPVALLFLLVDLACLVFDLGSPTKFHHMLRVFKPSSPMSLGTWCLTVYSMPLTIVAAIDVLTYLGLFPRDSSVLARVHWLGLIVGLLPALGSSAYKGVLFSTSSQPGWKDARWLGAYLVNSALMFGTAGLMVIATEGRTGDAADILWRALKVLGGLNLVLLGLLAIELRGVLAIAFSRGRLIRLGLVAVGAGFVLPHELMTERKIPLGVPMAFASMLVAAYFVRSALVQLPHLVRGPDHLSSEA